MKYKSFEAAKIANPEEEIFKLDDGSFVTPNWINNNDFVKHVFTICHAKDYCMSVGEFLSKGGLVFSTDLHIDEHGKVKTIGYKPFGCSTSLEKSYILKAAALEDGIEEEHETPKRVKVEYVECDNLQDALDKFESMSGFEFYPDENGDGERINSVRNLAMAYGHGSLYLKVETPIEWWKDALQFTKDNAENKITVHESQIYHGGELFIKASMSRDKWCDFARILLEQGE